MVGPRIDVEAELDRLFALRPGDFVAARNALAAHLRASGDVVAAARIKALKKPTVPAWAVNQLRFEAPRILAALLASGDRLRSGSSDMPNAMQARREAISAARKKAAELLVAAGQAATPHTIQSVSSTLEALATYGKAPDRVLAGRLTEALPAPGFDDLASLGVLRSPAATQRAPLPNSPVPPTAAARVSDKAERMSAREGAVRAKALSARKQEAAKLHGKLAAAERKVELARKRRQKLEIALASASQAEHKSKEALVAARKAVEAADIALRDLNRQALTRRPHEAA